MPGPRQPTSPPSPTAAGTAELDLTYTLGEDFPAYAPGEEAVRSPATTIEANGYYLQCWDFFEHIGTHVDAPAHFNPTAATPNELTPGELMVPAVVIDIAVVPPLTPTPGHGRRPARSRTAPWTHRPGTAVLMYSGWGAKVADPAAYRGTDAAGVLHFPASAPTPASGC